MRPLLEGYNAFITGAASGIGKAISLSFARHGINHLAITDLTLPPLLSLSNQITQTYPCTTVLPLQLDVRSETQVSEVLHKITTTHPPPSNASHGKNGPGKRRLDIAINNAGIPASGTPTHRECLAGWRAVMETNLDGVFLCQRGELGVMLEQQDLGVRRGRGVVVNVSSVLGVRGLGRSLGGKCGKEGPGGGEGIGFAAYIAAKHGVMGLTKADARVYGPKAVRIAAVCPGFVRTEGMEGLLGKDFGGDPDSHDGGQVEENMKSWLGREIRKAPLGGGRLAEVEEVAEAVVWMASPMGSYFHGTGLVLDGGFSA